MEKYVIGLIDEDDEDVSYIKRTILLNKPSHIREEQILFSRFPIPDSAETLTGSFVTGLIERIISSTINSLVVDYKLVAPATVLEGTEVFQRIAEAAPKFPMIILSNLPDVCYGKDFVDADKVYSKKQFFKLEEQYSKEKTANLFRNMDNYVQRRTGLLHKLDSELQSLAGSGYDERTLQRVIETEKLLGDFCPQGQSAVEENLNVSELREAVRLLREADELLGGASNEDS